MRRLIHLVLVLWLLSGCAPAGPPAAATSVPAAAGQSAAGTAQTGLPAGEVRFTTEDGIEISGSA